MLFDYHRDKTPCLTIYVGGRLDLHPVWSKGIIQKDPSQLTKYCSMRQKPYSNNIQGHLKYHFYQEKFPKSLIQDLHLKHIAKLVSLYHIQYTLKSYLLYTRHSFKSLTNTNTFISKLFNTIINPKLKTIELKFRDIK